MATVTPATFLLVVLLPALLFGHVALPCGLLAFHCDPEYQVSCLGNYVLNAVGQQVPQEKNGRGYCFAPSFGQRAGRAVLATVQMCPKQQQSLQTIVVKQL